MANVICFKTEGSGSNLKMTQVNSIAGVLGTGVGRTRKRTVKGVGSRKRKVKGVGSRKRRSR
ncbi:MAG: hypothetical protein RIS64_4229 [Bacteroidota bacterium]|jgi:hypothetical protein